MKSYIAMIAAVTIVAANVSFGQSQFHLNSGHQSQSGYHHRHSYTHHTNVHRLSALVGQMEEVVSHLHEDAHELSQDYVNSDGIERYVSQLEELKVHMHTMLEAAEARHRLSFGDLQHIKHDTREVRTLLNTFYSLIEGQAYMGARPADQSLLDHMQDIVLHEAYPLLGRVETELYGRPQGDLCPLHYTPAHTEVHHGHVETHTSGRPAIPAWAGPMPPFASRILNQRGVTTPVVKSHHHGHSGGSIQIGRLRIRF